MAADERVGAAEALVEHRPEGEEIGALGRLPSSDALRGDVARGADDLLRAGDLGDELGDPEIGEQCKAYVWTSVPKEMIF